MGDRVMKFSFEDYQDRMRAGKYRPPDTFRPYVRIRPDAYTALNSEHEVRGLRVEDSFEQLQMRVGSDYFWKVYPVQSETLDWAQLSFPSYRFILAEVLQDDWLATVDWHKYNRDHALHQPLTAYIVLKMLNGAGDRGWKVGGRYILDLCVDVVINSEKTCYLREFLKRSDSGRNSLPDFLFDGNVLSREIWKAMFVESAFLAANFHDLGYPWQYVNRLNSKLEHAGYLKDSPTADSERVIEDFGKRLLFCPLNGYMNVGPNAPSTWREKLIEQTATGLRETHGLPGAIGFLYLNDVLRDYPDSESALREFCVEWASMAVMMHDMKKVYWGREETTTPPENKHLQLQFEADPLSCVVTLADVLQDFNRPSVKFSSISKDTARAQYEHEVNSSELVYRPSRNTLQIKFNCRDADSARRKEVFIQDDQEEYFDSQWGYLDLSACGIEQTELICV
jgi:hypothetical protein